MNYLMYILLIIGQTQVEKDEMCSLLTYSIVAKTWQTELNPNKRGHNIGAILVDENNNPVAWGINCNNSTQNGTNHAEVRTITSYLTVKKTRTLKNCTVYTTLEPCAMCAGMICLQDVKRVVYGQTDPLFGQAFERLGMNSKLNGLPYPRRPQEVVLSTTEYATILDNIYDKNKYRSITDFLLTPDARIIFLSAQDKFEHYQTNDNNIEYHRKLLYFYNHLDEFDYNKQLGR